MSRKPPANAVPMLGVVQAPDDEKSYERLIRDTAHRFGWTSMKPTVSPFQRGGGRGTIYMTATSVVGLPDPLRKNHGWPDLTLMHPEGYLLMLEVKGTNGTASPEQKAVMVMLQKFQAQLGGSDRFAAAIVKPRDWPVVEHWLAAPTGGARTGG